jgi:hypothetical protein
MLDVLFELRQAGASDATLVERMGADADAVAVFADLAKMETMAAELKEVKKEVKQLRVENELLRSENEQLRAKLDSIDKRADNVRAAFQNLGCGPLAPNFEAQIFRILYSILRLPNLQLEVMFILLLVREKVESGAIAISRYQSYLSMLADEDSHR